MAGTPEPNGQVGKAAASRSRVARLLAPLAGLFLIGMAVAACGSSAQPTTTSTTSGGGGHAIVNLAHSSFGKILVTKNRLTLYYYTADTPKKIACTGACAQSWPPLIYTGSGTPVGGPGVTGLGTIKRPGGGVQVTYKGKPLYTFISDTPGHTTGQGVAGFQVVILGGSSSGTTTTTSSSGGGYGY